MRIKIPTFGGMLPRIQDRMLPPRSATVAEDVLLYTGSARPLRFATDTYAFPGDIAYFMRHNGAFYGWDVPGISAAPGPVAQDRLYITGDGAPKLRYGGSTYPLALSAPVSEPVVAFTNAPATPSPNDPDDSLPWLPASGGTVPAALIMVRQPVGNVSGSVLITQPAVAVVDAAGLLCAGDNTTIATVSIGTGVLGYLGGTRSALASAGVIRFQDLTLSGDDEIDYRLTFEAGDLAAVASDAISVTDNMADVTSTILYAYTYVTSLGEESPPSLMSSSLDWYPGLIVRVSNFAAPPAGRLVTKIRIYRSVTSLAGVTDLYFVAEIDAAMTSYDHNLETAPIAEVLPSADFDTPPDTMDGIIALPNGMMAAFDGRELLFSEPFKPHAWPTKYRLTTDYDIVGLGAFGSTVAVLTEGTPYIVTGTAPESMVMEKLEINLPCVSRRGIVDLGYSIAYPSIDGLVMIGPAGAQNVTQAFLTREQWRALLPASMIAEQFNGMYVASSLIEADEPARRTIIFGVAQGEEPLMATTSEDIRAMARDESTGALYVIEADDLAQVRQWDAGTPRGMTWQSGVMLTGYEVNFGAFRIIADKDPGTEVLITFIADGREVHRSNVKNRPARLPSGFEASEWQIKITGSAEVFAVSIASTMEELLND